MYGFFVKETLLPTKESRQDLGYIQPTVQWLLDVHPRTVTATRKVKNACRHTVNPHITLWHGVE